MQQGAVMRAVLTACCSSSSCLQWEPWQPSFPKLPTLLCSSFCASPACSEQLTAFELWLEHGGPDKRPPEQLPIVLQVRCRRCPRAAGLGLLAACPGLLPSHIVTSAHCSPSARPRARPMPACLA